MNNILLSICIPTYNRVNELSELIDSILKIERNDFEVVITDNLSTDKTKEVVLSYQDARVRYCQNDTALPAFLNMIRSIYNAKGKYAFYCNDRDLINTANIGSLMDFLNEGEYSFVQTRNRIKIQKKPINASVFKKGFDSFTNHTYQTHPTGMVFNRQLIAEKNLPEDRYREYLPCVYTVDFLKFDLFKYEQSAKFYKICWLPRDKEYVASTKSGIGVASFTPKVSTAFVSALIKYIFYENPYSLTEQQRKVWLNDIYIYYGYLLRNYKTAMADKLTVEHYNMSTKFISIRELFTLYDKFMLENKAILDEIGIEKEMQSYLDRRKLLYKVIMVMRFYVMRLKSLLYWILIHIHVMLAR